MNSRKNIAKTLFLGAILSGCGSSMKDVTNPGWREKQDAEEAKKARGNVGPEILAVKSELIFDLKSEESACGVAAKQAEKLKVTLENCVLADGKLGLTVNRDGQSDSQTLDLSQDVSEMVVQIHETVKVKALETFFMTMSNAILFSKTQK